MLSDWVVSDALSVTDDDDIDEDADCCEIAFEVVGMEIGERNWSGMAATRTFQLPKIVSHTNHDQAKTRKVT